jgi:PEP-CTERM motif-containing protein
MRTFRGTGGTNIGRKDRADIPEPLTWAMLLIGFAGIGFAAYRSKRNLVMA